MGSGRHSQRCIFQPRLAKREMKKRKLEKLCDYWENEATRNDDNAALWRRQYLEVNRTLEALRADPLTVFRAEFRAEAIRQIDAWPAGCDDVDPIMNRGVPTPVV